MSKKDELLAGLTSTFLPPLPASELAKARDLTPGENRSDLLGDKPPIEVKKPVKDSEEPLAPETHKESVRLKVKGQGRTKTIARDVEETIASTRESRFAQFVPHTFRLSTEQIAVLAESELLILRNGLKKKERVSNNSVLRALVDLLAALKLEMGTIDCELALRKVLFDRCGVKGRPSDSRTSPEE